MVDLSPELRAELTEEQRKKDAFNIRRNAGYFTKNIAKDFPDDPEIQAAVAAIREAAEIIMGKVTGEALLSPREARAMNAKRYKPRKPR